MAHQGNNYFALLDGEEEKDSPQLIARLMAKTVANKNKERKESDAKKSSQNITGITSSLVSVVYHTSENQGEGIVIGFKENAESDARKRSGSQERKENDNAQMINKKAQPKKSVERKKKAKGKKVEKEENNNLEDTKVGWSMTGEKGQKKASSFEGWRGKFPRSNLFKGTMLVAAMIIILSLFPEKNFTGSA